MSSENAIDDPNEIRFRNIIGMGLDFSSMIRLFERGSEDRLWEKLVFDVAPKIFKAQSKEEFDQIHHEFCEWGARNIVLAEKKRRDGRILKSKGPASYGQIAKTIDVTLKVAVYYSHLPNFQKYEIIMSWLNAGVDTRMMAMLKRKYPNAIKEWPNTVEAVDKAKYSAIQETVRTFIREEHNGRLLPVQFDDIYWYKLNP